MVTRVSGGEDLRPGGCGCSGDGRSRSLVRKSRVAASSWPCWRMPSSMKEYCADLASRVARPAITTISSARLVSVIEVAFGDSSMRWTRPSMKVVTVTVPGGLVTVNSGTGSSSDSASSAADRARPTRRPPCRHRRRRPHSHRARREPTSSSRRWARRSPARPDRRPRSGWCGGEVSTRGMPFSPGRRCLRRSYRTRCQMGGTRPIRRVRVAGSRWYPAGSCRTTRH